MATFCGGIKLGNSLEVVNGIIALANGEPTDESVITVCGQKWDGEVFGIARKNGADVVTSATPSTVAPLVTIKSNCGIKLDARYFDMSSGSVQYGMKYFMKVNTDPIDATILVEQGDTEIEPVNGVYPVEDAKTYDVTVTKTGFEDFTDDVTIDGEDVVLDIELEPLSDAKAITAFNFAGLEPVVVGVIDEEEKTIALTVPTATVVTALVATFTNSEDSTVKVGEVAQESGVTENDFTNAVEYVVTAEDTTTATYTVTVTIATAE